MNRLELISALESVTDTAQLGVITKKAIELLRSASEVEIVIGEGRLSAEHFQKIGLRRFSRCKHLGLHVPGLEETVQSLVKTSGELRAAYVEIGDLIVQFYLDNDNSVKGCIIGESNASL